MDIEIYSFAVELRDLRSSKNVHARTYTHARARTHTHTHTHTGAAAVAGRERRVLHDAPLEALLKEAPVSDPPSAPH